MAHRRVLIIHEDKELPRILEKDLSRVSSWIVTFEHLSKQPSLPDHRHYDLIILESKKGLMGSLQQMQSHHSTAWDSPILSIPSGLLKKNCKRILDTAQTLLEDSERPTRVVPRQNGRLRTQDPFLEDFVERKFKDFVKKSKAGEARNLYTLLVKEVERPLISLMLKETDGNQIQAALMLGMNRNTLRKKIKELRISLKQN
jgi:two-component system nitrogen regulation response regulator GlnG